MSTDRRCRRLSGSRGEEHTRPSADRAMRRGRRRSAVAGRDPLGWSSRSARRGLSPSGSSGVERLVVREEHARTVGGGAMEGARVAVAADGAGRDPRGRRAGALVDVFRSSTVARLESARPCEEHARAVVLRHRRRTRVQCCCRRSAGRDPRGGRAGALVDVDLLSVSPRSRDSFVVKNTRVPSVETPREGHL